MRHVPRYGGHVSETGSISGGGHLQSLKVISSHAALWIAALMQSGARAEPPTVEARRPINTIQQWIRQSGDTVISDKIQRWKRAAKGMDHEEYPTRAQATEDGNAVLEEMMPHIEEEISPVTNELLVNLAEDPDQQEDEPFPSPEQKWRFDSVTKDDLQKKTYRNLRIPIFEGTTAADAIHTFEECGVIRIDIDPELWGKLTTLQIPRDRKNFADILEFICEEANINIDRTSDFHITLTQSTENVDASVSNDKILLMVKCSPGSMNEKWTVICDPQSAAVGRASREEALKKLSSFYHSSMESFRMRIIAPVLVKLFQ